MSTEDPIELEIEVLVKDTTEEDLDKMTRNLLKELRGTNVESANLVSIGTAPEGSKGDPVTIGTLALEVLPARSFTCRSTKRYCFSAGLGHARTGADGEVQGQRN